MKFDEKIWFLGQNWKFSFNWEETLNKSHNPNSNEVKNSIKDKTKLLLLFLFLSHWWNIGSSNISNENGLKGNLIDKNEVSVDMNTNNGKIFEMNDWKWVESEMDNSTENEVTKSTEGLAEKKFPPTDYFWWVRLSKTGTYNNIPWNPVRLKRTGRGCATNPTYENALVMTQSGRTRRVTHRETYYTTKSFPVSNIEWRIRSVLNKDRERNWLKEIPQNQKVRNTGADWTIRDMNWYIVVAASKNYPFGTLIMTTLWPGRVYDRWGKVHGNHIDVYTNWPK